MHNIYRLLCFLRNLSPRIFEHCYLVYTLLFSCPLGPWCTGTSWSARSRGWSGHKGGALVVQSHLRPAGRGETAWTHGPSLPRGESRMRSGRARARCQYRRETIGKFFLLLSLVYRVLQPLPILSLLLDGGADKSQPGRLPLLLSAA